MSDVLLYAWCPPPAESCRNPYRCVCVWLCASHTYVHRTIKYVFAISHSCAPTWKAKHNVRSIHKRTERTNTCAHRRIESGPLVLPACCACAASARARRLCGKNQTACVHICAHARIRFSLAERGKRSIARIYKRDRLSGNAQYSSTSQR